ncbi:MAG: hypothetical protein CMO55_23185 [Verrucomicrobiales bacterium]|nr:hypothetical protein [Verrucomicrobiales bacterium]
MRETSPVLELVRCYMGLRGVSRKGLVDALAGGGNPNKAQRRLDEFLHEQGLDVELVKRIGEVLDVPEDEMSASIREHWEIRAEEYRQRVLVPMCPCVRTIFCKGYINSFARGLVKAYLGTKRLPGGFLDLPEGEQFAEARRVATGMAARLPVEGVERFELWRTPEERVLLFHGGTD